MKYEEICHEKQKIAQPPGAGLVLSLGLAVYLLTFTDRPKCSPLDNDTL
jgi:hypothetical protein